MCRFGEGKGLREGDVAGKEKEKTTQEKKKEKEKTTQKKETETEKESEGP